MNEPILKAVSMPPRIFWAPMIPAVVNLAVQLSLMFTIGIPMGFNPLVFVASILIVHIGIIIYGVKEPHLSKMMKAQGPLMTPSKNIYGTRGNKLAP